MSKRSTDSDGNRIGGHAGYNTSVTHTANGDVHSEPNVLMELVSRPSDVGRVMSFFSDHGGGCLKVRRSETGQDLHLTWTWAAGKHRGFYVYVRVEYWRLLFGLELLEVKVLEAEAGRLRPSPDKLVVGT